MLVQLQLLLTSFVVGAVGTKYLNKIGGTVVYGVASNTFSDCNLICLGIYTT